MHMIHLLLPLHDNNRRQFEPQQFQIVRRELTERFGGVTAFLRSPAVGLWKEDDETVSRDEVVMFEILSDRFDEHWWQEYRRKLEADFKQDEILIWAVEVKKL
jgi:hypothetical protein